IMHDRAYAVATGIFVIAALTALALTAYWLTGAEQERRPYVVVSPYSVAGLTEGSEVLYHGVPAGRVLAVSVDPTDPAQVLIEIAVGAEIPVLESTFATLHQRGLTGVAQIELEHAGTDAEPLQTSKDAPARIEMVPSLIDQVTDAGSQALAVFREIARTLDEALNERNREKLASLAGRMDRLLASIESLTASLETELPATLGSAGRAAEAVTELAERTTASMDDVDALIAELRATAATARALGDELSDGGVARLEETLASVDSAAEEIARLARELARQPERVLRGGGRAAPG